MKETIRRAIVSTVIAKTSGNHPSSIFSHSRSERTAMGSRYDYGASAHFTDSYHYGEGSHFTIRMNGSSFSGYDYGSGNHFSGTVSGRTVRIYDHGEGQYFNYTT
jgi:hypothetical protein